MRDNRRESNKINLRNYSIIITRGSQQPQSNATIVPNELHRNSITLCFDDTVIQLHRNYNIIQTF